jgi:hypothetical protein
MALISNSLQLLSSTLLVSVEQFVQLGDGLKD